MLYADRRTRPPGRRRRPDRALLREGRTARSAFAHFVGLPGLWPGAPRAAELRAPLPFARHAARRDQAPDRRIARLRGVVRPGECAGTHAPGSGADETKGAAGAGGATGSAERAMRERASRRRLR